MTPTEQDKELREQIGDIFARACKNNEYFGNDGWYELHTPTLRAEIQSLITADRKRVELGARIDEWNLIGETLHAASIESERHVEKVRNDRLDELSKKAGNDD